VGALDGPTAKRRARSALSRNLRFWGLGCALAMVRLRLAAWFAHRIAVDQMGSPYYPGIWGLLPQNIGNSGAMNEFK
jgi:hypothetical protein